MKYVGLTSLLSGLGDQLVRLAAPGAAAVVTASNNIAEGVALDTPVALQGKTFTLRTSGVSSFVTYPNNFAAWCAKDQTCNGAPNNNIVVKATAVGSTGVYTDITSGWSTQQVLQRTIGNNSTSTNIAIAVVSPIVKLMTEYKNKDGLVDGAICSGGNCTWSVVLPLTSAYNGKYPAQVTCMLFIDAGPSNQLLTTCEYYQTGNGGSCTSPGVWFYPATLKSGQSTVTCYSNQQAAVGAVQWTYPNGTSTGTGGTTTTTTDSGSSSKCGTSCKIGVGVGVGVGGLLIIVVIVVIVVMRRKGQGVQPAAAQGGAPPNEGV